MIQPRRKAGTACDFDRLETTTVRWAISGNDDGLTCGRAKARSSYTSSDTSHRSWRRQRSAIAVISSAVNTAPVGLCGELIQTTRVRGVTAAASAGMSG